jgi:hypothetical protein
MRRSLVLAFLTTAGCGTLIKFEPVKVEPIHMTIDVNVHSAADASPTPKPGSPEPVR